MKLSRSEHIAAPGLLPCSVKRSVIIPPPPRTNVLIIHGMYRFRPKRIAFRNDYCLSCAQLQRSVQIRTRRSRQESTSTGWGTRARTAIRPREREKRCPTATTGSNTSVRCARSGPRKRAWASNFHPKSALLDGMDGKSKFSPSQKWL